MGRLRLIGVLLAVLLGLYATGCSKEIQIGAVISETGVADTYGDKVRKGLDLALDEINQAGGIGGRPALLVYRDDRSRPEVGAEVVTELIDDLGIRTVIGAVTSTVTLEIAPICERKRTVLLSPTASAPKITDAGMYIFRNYPSDILEGTSMADFARDLGLEKVVVFAVDNEFGAGLKEVFTQKFESKFRQVVRIFDFKEEDRDSFGSMVEETKALEPEGIYLVGYVNEVAELLKLIREVGIDAVTMGPGSTTEDVVMLAGRAAEHLVYPQPPFDLESQQPEVRSFVEAYRAQYGEDPDTFAAHGYDAMKLIAIAFERAGSAHPDEVRSGLGSIQNHKGASGTAGFDKNGDVVQYPRLFIIHQGKPISYERFLEQGGSLAISRRS